MEEEKKCGNCGHFIPEETKSLGSIEVHSEWSSCTLFKEIRGENQKPKSWCWKPKKG